jgi:sec-independent protein translocase protein TatB
MPFLILLPESHRELTSRSAWHSYRRAFQVAAPAVVPMEITVFDLSLTKLLILAVLALVVFGPNELPKIAAQAGRALRELRRIAEGAKADLREGLGPEFSDFDIDDLSPRRFVQKHLFSEFTGPDSDGNDIRGAASDTAILPGGNPSFDAEAT